VKRQYTSSSPPRERNHFQAGAECGWLPQLSASQTLVSAK
jgi:hypothetical protein